MSVVRPFAALRFARDPEPRLAPPWDVISPAERERLAAEPENIVHLTLPPGAEGARDYASAGRTLERWIAERVLVRDPAPVFYAVAERTAAGRVRRGLLGLLRLADYAERVVFPHERTMPHAKQDRLLLTRAVRANLEPLFFVYPDRDAKLAPVFESAAAVPLVDCRGPDRTAIQLRRVEDRAAIQAVETFFADRSVVIADGHHRYETMLRYRDEQRAQAGGAQPDAPWEFVLAYLVNALDPGTEIRAIHRRVDGAVSDPLAALVARGFALHPLEPSTTAGAALARLAGHAAGEHAFALAPAGAPPVLALRPRGAALDVRVLHEELLPAIGGELSFDADAERLLAAARAGECALAILMNPLPAEQLFAEVEQGAVLPQKSTFFTPKLPSGLVLRQI
jgi:uncharacterized protein (DUF1015 family)